MVLGLRRNLPACWCAHVFHAISFRHRKTCNPLHRLTSCQSVMYTVIHRALHQLRNAVGRRYSSAVAAVSQKHRLTSQAYFSATRPGNSSACSTHQARTQNYHPPRRIQHLFCHILIILRLVKSTTLGRPQARPLVHQEVANFRIT